MILLGYWASTSCEVLGAEVARLQVAVVVVGGEVSSKTRTRGGMAGWEGHT
jgi:hypothetical protein